jgi:hypothetical protein
MKTRNGFVSNSSSSSFVVVWPHAPSSADDVHEMLFDHERKLEVVYERSLSSREVAGVVWEDFLVQQDQEYKEEQLNTAFSGCEMPHAAELADLRRKIAAEPDDYEAYDAWRKAYIAAEDAVSWFAQARKQVTEELGPCPDYEDKDYYQWSEREGVVQNEIISQRRAEVMAEIGDQPFSVFEYGDSHGNRVSAVLEHGDVFSNIKHWRFSHH